MMTAPKLVYTMTRPRMVCPIARRIVSITTQAQQPSSRPGSVR
jgi:hypothetical protein